MFYRSYTGLDGQKRTLRYIGEMPYNVPWHTKFKPCRAELWLTENNHQIQLPVTAWRAVVYTDFDDCPIREVQSTADDP